MQVPFVVGVNPKLPINSIPELIACEDEFTDFVMNDYEQWKSVAKSANIVVE